MANQIDAVRVKRELLPHLFNQTPQVRDIIDIGPPQLDIGITFLDAESYVHPRTTLPEVISRLLTRIFQ